MGVSEEINAIEREAYLVERGVRPIALMGTRPADATEKVRLLTQLKKFCYKMDVKPFVIDRNDGAVEYGIASAGWALDLFKWLLSAKIPQVQKDRIQGLLFGYDIKSIARFEELSNGQLNV